MVAGLEELTAACSKQPLPSESDRIAEGDSHWFVGRPLPAAPGTVALAQGGPVKIVLRVEDILAVHRWGELFVVKVKAGTNTLVSMESVVKADAGTCCGGDKSAVPESSVARIAVQDPPRDPDDWDVWLNHYWNGCLWNFECIRLNIPIIGQVKICYPTHILC